MAMSPAKAKPLPGRVMFLADCGPEVGGGHVMRCLSLARALLDLGATCAFVATPAAGKVLDAFADPRIQRLPADGAPLHALVDAARDHAAAWNANVGVVDHYGLSGEQEARIAIPIATIDDLADRPHRCMLLIDPSLGRETRDYEHLTPPGALTLTGPAYALLAPAYAEARGGAIATRRPQEPPRRLLVSLGLMDLRGITGRVLHRLQPLPDGLEMDVVVGGQASSLTWLRHLAEADPRVTLHVDTQDMASLIAAADIGIGAGGSSSWERAVLGLPSISLVLADNQRALALEMDHRRACLAVDARGESFGAQLSGAFGRLLSDGELRKRLSERSAALCDGQGAARAAKAVLELVA